MEDNNVSVGYFSSPPEEDVLRILVATDNHMGFMENDPIRCDDSFDTLEEIMKIGRDCNVDMAVFGGDLFHQNNPSRSCLTRTLKVFRKYCMGSREVNLLSRGRFESGKRSANYEDEHLAIDLPVFIIHGNHDDPIHSNNTSGALSAIHVLSDAGLVNYFGVVNDSADAVIEPVVIEKGTTKLKLYGMGWLRDERMFRMFEEDKVRFCAELEEEGNEDDKGNRGKGKEWFNLFMVHQNRDIGNRGRKNCFQENMIPNFMDLVLFGHEHECLIEPTESAIVNGCFMSQPGSSVVTSLTLGESQPKRVGILEIFLNEETMLPSFTFKNIKLQSTRPYAFDEITLNEFDGLDAEASEETKKKQITALLSDKVDDMRKEVMRTYKQNKSRQQLVGEKKKMLPLVRLRVDYTGFVPINVQRFGEKFAKTVANYSTILQFHKKKVMGKRKGQGDDEHQMEIEEILKGADEGNEETAQEKIPQLVANILENEATSLKTIPKNELNNKIHDFVQKEDPHLISKYLKDLLNETVVQCETLADITTESNADEIANLINPGVQDKDNKAKKKAKTGANISDLDEDDDNDSDAASKKKKKKKKQTKRKKKQELSDSSDGDIETPKNKKAAASTKTKRQKRKEISDDDSDDSFLAHKPRKGRKKATTTKPRKKAVVASSEDDSEGGESPPNKRAKKASASPRTGRDARGRAKQHAGSQNDSRKNRKKKEESIAVLNSSSEDDFQEVKKKRRARKRTPVKPKKPEPVLSLSSSSEEERMTRGRRRRTDASEQTQF